MAFLQDLDGIATQDLSIECSPISLSITQMPEYLQDAEYWIARVMVLRSA
jgi:hypothetical protein